jgi:hypothetical protein
MDFLLVLTLKTIMVGLKLILFSFKGGKAQILEDLGISLFYRQLQLAYSKLRTSDNTEAASKMERSFRNI